ncbi:hypothetical protein C5748_02695 [Phyllobacterium phragmitis]|uniref:Uncharacterized protein n=2 Tax=Phyllobacterium phragmitis TaxID=2670329 RepID=A0A2S9IX92_9HYPH|nr:hypothetical protein C5748_02695 [Phyllobacterium phragmitis]
MEHYDRLDADQLMSSVLSHYKAMWKPLIEPLIIRQSSDETASSLVLEGSALLPDHAVQVLTDRVFAAWLTASEDLIRNRIYAESRYSEMVPFGRKLVDRFLDRTLAFNHFIRSEVVRLSLPNIDVGEDVSEEELALRCLEMMGPNT